MHELLGLIKLSSRETVCMPMHIYPFGSLQRDAFLKFSHVEPSLRTRGKHLYKERHQLGGGIVFTCLGKKSPGIFKLLTQLNKPTWNSNIRQKKISFVLPMKILGCLLIFNFFPAERSDYWQKMQGFSEMLPHTWVSVSFLPASFFMASIFYFRFKILGCFSATSDLTIKYHNMSLKCPYPKHFNFLS